MACGFSMWPTDGWGSKIRDTQEKTEPVSSVFFVRAASPTPRKRQKRPYISEHERQRRRKSPKRRQWRMKRGGFEEVSRLAVTKWPGIG